MSEILNQLRGVASITQIEDEQRKLRESSDDLLKQVDALEVFRKSLLIERHGKQPRQTRKPRERNGTAEPSVRPEPLSESEDLPELPSITAKGDDPQQPAVLRCLNLLSQSAPLAIADISRILRIPYGTIHQAIKSDSRFTVALGKWTVKRKS